MANRHKKYASGGKIDNMERKHVYSGAGSNVAKEAESNENFKKGGKTVGKAPGGKGKSRYARGGRAGSDDHPFSSAYVGPSGGGGK